MAEEASGARVYGDERLEQVIERVDSAREELLRKAGVVGVGYGPKERDGHLLDGELVIVVYVVRKKDEDELDPEDVIPSMISDVPTDVVKIGSRENGRQAHADHVWIDYPLLHDRNPFKEVSLE